jgi:putative flippase GtrA
MLFQLARFVGVGGFLTVLGYAIIFSLQNGLMYSPQFSNFAGYMICLGLSFLLHRNLTFASSNKASSELFLFLVVFCVAYAANFAALSLFVACEVSAVYAQILAGIVYVAASFALNKRFVFSLKE